MTTARKVLLVLGLILGVPLLALAVLVVVVSIDEAPPFDDDLRVVRLQIPDDQNAYTYFKQAIDKLDLPKDDEPPLDSPAPPPKFKPAPGEERAPNTPPTRRQRWDALANDEVDWDQPIVDEVLKRNEAALALLDKGLAAPHFQWPEIKTFEQSMEGPGTGYLRIAELLAFRAASKAKRGDYEAAHEDFAALVRFGHKIESGKGYLVQYLLGVTIKQTGNWHMRRHLPGCALPSARLRQYAAELGKFPATAEDLVGAFRAECSFNRMFLQWVRRGEVPATILSSAACLEPEPTAASWVLKRLPASRPFFKPNRTARQYAEFMRVLIDAAPKHGREAQDSAMVLDQRRKFHPVRSALAGNLFGDALSSVYVLTFQMTLALKCNTNVDIAATRTLLAMKAYKLDKGRLPETLEQLVPEYLDAVPIDDFDGKPLRYNAAKKIIYSVGKDLEDDGGTTRQEFIEVKAREMGVDPKDEQQVRDHYLDAEYPWEAPDPAFAIEF